MIKTFKITIAIAGMLFLAMSSQAATTIDPINKYAWGANIGFTNWRPSVADGVNIGPNFCSGSIYAANVGWISLGDGTPTNGTQYSNTSAADFGVNCTAGAAGERNLRGVAYGANIGWINFESTGNPRVILASGRLRGFVYSANCGWLNLDDATVFVQTAVATPTPPPTPTPTSSPTLTPTPTATPIATPSPTPTPVPPTPTPATFTISGAVTYCSNPIPGPVPLVTLTVTGSMATSTLTDLSGNYALSSLNSGGSYTVTPSKPSLISGAPGSSINTTDVVAIQRHFLNFIQLNGCRLTAADVNGDAFVNTVDVVAVQRFFLGYFTGVASTGQYSFNPPNRTYPTLLSNQTNQNFDTLLFGDVAAPFGGRVPPGTYDDQD